MHTDNIFKWWFLLVIVLTACAGIVYGASQQVLRQGANDPQIQLAEDTASKLSAGIALEHVVPSEKVDIAASLAPYIIVYAENGQVLASSATLNGAAPVMPTGVLAYTLTHAENRVTWQPAPTVRSAIVVTHFTGALSGFVVAGRSLREVEIREDDLLTEIATFWAAGVLGTLLFAIFFHHQKS